MTPHNPPKDWQLKTIEEVCEITMGQSPKGDEVFSLTDEIQPNTEALEFHQGKIHFSDKFIQESKFITTGIRKKAPKDSILLCVRAPVGIVNLTQREIAIGRGLCAIKGKKIDTLYLFYFLQTQKSYFESLATGSTFSAINLSIVKNTPIPLPPLEIQREIVEILESKLEKIKEAKALLETSLQECETYRLSLLESAFSGNLTPHSQKWQWVRLGEVCDTSSGGTPSRTQLSYWDGEIKWLKSGELNDGLIDNVGETITQEGLKHSSAKLLPKGTLLIAMYGATIGRLGILNVETSTNQAICAITPKEENTLDTKFLFYFLFASRPKMLQDSFGGAQKNISQAYLKQFSIPLPPLEIQREIVEILESKLEKIKEAKALLETSLQECETYRLSLLESAFAGELV